MYLAIVNEATGLVENTIVPPSGAQAWFVPAGYKAIETTEAGVGDYYIDGKLVKKDPDPQAEVQSS